MSPAVNRVPQILLIYWVIKIASTTLGETGADMFSMTFDLGYAATLLLFLGLFGVFLGFKLAVSALRSGALLAGLYGIGDRGDGDLGFHRSFAGVGLCGGLGGSHPAAAGGAGDLAG